MEQERRSILVRLNGKEQDVHEVRDELGATRDLETDSMEELIPKPDNVIDFGQLQEERKKKGQPFWDDGIRERAPKLPFKRKKKTVTSQGRRSFPTMLLLAICSAVIVGISFGFMILTVFTGDKPDSAEIVRTEEGVPALAEGIVELPTITVDVVQGGAFSSMEKATEILTRIQEMGFAAALTKETEPIYMFIGLGGDRAQSTAISQLYEAQNLETYLKSYRIEASNSQEVDQAVTSWFYDASASFQELLQLSVDGLTREGAIVTGEQVSKIDEQLSVLQGKRDGAFQKLPDSAKPYALAMGDALVKAGESLEKYVQTEDKMSLWKAQQELLTSLISYEQVINTWK